MQNKRKIRKLRVKKIVNFKKKKKKKNILQYFYFDLLSLIVILCSHISFNWDAVGKGFLFEYPKQISLY